MHIKFIILNTLFLISCGSTPPPSVTTNQCQYGFKTNLGLTHLLITLAESEISEQCLNDLKISCTEDSCVAFYGDKK